MTGDWKKASREIRSMARPKHAKHLMGFFKTGPGQYGAGDKFLGLTVPVVRALAKKYAGLSLKDLDRLGRSPWHEERLLALIILVNQTQKAENEKARKANYDFYVGHMKWINNWDLVDVTAEHVTGAWLWDHPRGILFRWARSKRLWDRRVAVLSTFHFIRKGRFNETLRLARMLLRDREDLMHKAVGWLLREVGKRDESVLRRFLGANAVMMPRTMLRYSIEKFTPAERKKYLGLRRARG